LLLLMPTLIVPVPVLVLLLLLLVGLALMNLGAVVAQRRLIFKPPRWRRRLEPGPHADSYVIEPLTLQVEPGVVLEGWRSVPADGSAPRCCMVYFGGRGENVLWAPHMSSYTPGLSVLAVNYRGFGGSGGRAGQAEVLGDALAIHRHLVAPGPASAAAPAHGARPQVVVMGRSLGTAVAVHLASQVQPQALVLVSPFDSLVAVMLGRLPWLWPASLLLRHRLPAVGAARQVCCPTLAVLAVGDRQVPARRSAALLQALRGPVQRHDLVGEVHRSLPRCVPTQHLVAAFLDRVLNDAAADSQARPVERAER
jgi:pimeloyl-ACP methyl ester carboxylesterase